MLAKPGRSWLFRLTPGFFPYPSLVPSQGVAARQHDAWELGMTTTDDFTNADVIYEASLPAIKKALAPAPGTAQPEVGAGPPGLGPIMYGLRFVGCGLRAAGHAVADCLVCLAGVGATAGAHRDRLPGPRPEHRCVRMEGLGQRTGGQLSGQEGSIVAGGGRRNPGPVLVKDGVG